ncbi:hypothetical protein Dimus_026713 [Dionaea muscipula]
MCQQLKPNSQLAFHGEAHYLNPSCRLQRVIEKRPAATKGSISGPSPSAHEFTIFPPAEVHVQASLRPTHCPPSSINSSLATYHLPAHPSSGQHYTATAAIWRPTLSSSSGPAAFNEFINRNGSTRVQLSASSRPAMNQ